MHRSWSATAWQAIALLLCIAVAAHLLDEYLVPLLPALIGVGLAVVILRHLIGRR